MKISKQKLKLVMQQSYLIGKNDCWVRQFEEYFEEVVKE